MILAGHMLGQQNWDVGDLAYLLILGVVWIAKVLVERLGSKKDATSGEKKKQRDFDVVMEDGKMVLRPVGQRGGQSQAQSQIQSPPPQRPVVPGRPGPAPVRINPPKSVAAVPRAPGRPAPPRPVAPARPQPARAPSSAPPKRPSRRTVKRADDQHEITAVIELEDVGHERPNPRTLANVLGEQVGVGSMRKAVLLCELFGPPVALRKPGTGPFSLPG